MRAVLALVLLAGCHPGRYLVPAERGAEFQPERELAPSHYWTLTWPQADHIDSLMGPAQLAEIARLSKHQAEQFAKSFLHYGRQYTGFYDKLERRIVDVRLIEEWKNMGGCSADQPGAHPGDHVEAGACLCDLFFDWESDLFTRISCY